jgi:heat shock protein HslJ
LLHYRQEKTTVRLMILILAATLGCTASTATSENEQLRDRDWSLVWVEGFDSTPDGVATPTIRFGSDGRLGGNTGCNSAGAAYTVEGQSLKVDAVIATKRACLDPRGNALEHAYIRAIEAAEGYRISNGELELVDAAGTVVARFR